MQAIKLNLFDQTRSRSSPVLIYTPTNPKELFPVVIFNPGYQDQKDLMKPDNILAYRKWEYLAQYFTDKGYAFITIQHDLPGDTDGIESLDPKLSQVEARKHL